MSRQVELTGEAQRKHVVAGILRDSLGRILISDRSRAASMQQYWEFPGGKVEEDESTSRALTRELAEELGIRDVECERWQTIDHDYADIRVRIDFFIVSAWSGTPRGLEGQRLRWVKASELDAGLLLPADREIVETLRGKG